MRLLQIQSTEEEEEMPPPPPRPTSAANGSAAKSQQQSSAAAAALAALEDEEDDAFIPDADTIRSVSTSCHNHAICYAGKRGPCVHRVLLFQGGMGTSTLMTGWLTAGEQRRRGSDCALHIWLQTTFL